MKSKFLVVVFMAAALAGFSQDQKFYSTSGLEVIFSWADVTTNGNDQSSVLRFAPVFNFENWVNYDVNQNIGFFSGLAVRNVGFIYDDPTAPNVRIKARTYNLGIPAAVKIGNLSTNKFVFVGYELELPFHYKEKIFINEEKEDKATIWFTDRVPSVNHSLMAGLQFPYGATLKFKYYLTKFYKDGYQPNDDLGVNYATVNANVYYFSLSFGLFKNTEFYYNAK